METNWTKERVVALLDSNDRAVAKAVVAIYHRQTEAEKAIGETCENNGIGFNGSDAFILTSFAQFYQKNGYLSKKQTAMARKKIKKYTRQLLDCIGEKE